MVQTLGEDVKAGFITFFWGCLECRDKHFPVKTSAFWTLQQITLLSLTPPRCPATIWPDPNLGRSRERICVIW